MTNLQLHLQKAKRLGVNLTVLATSISLAACGGGGSEGYYGGTSSSNDGGGNVGGGNSSETDIADVPDSLTITLQDAAGQSLQNAQDNSQVKAVVKVLNKDKGGISGKQIRLSIADTDKIGVESASSKVTSDESGVATFTLNIPALQAASGKVQLVAVIDGTKVSIPYTLNIKKTSTITSDYNLTVSQGIVLNLPKGSAEFAVQVTDHKGGVKPGQKVELALPTEMNGKFVSTSGSSVTTDAEGKATFKIEAAANLTTSEIAQFTASSQTLTFKLIDENRAEKQATAALTFKDVSKVVDVLEVITPAASIAAKTGTTKVRVFAKNSSGNILSNTKVKLVVEAVAASYGVTLDKVEAITNTQGYAEFTLTSNATHPIALAQRGIVLTATVDSNPNIKGNVTVQVVTADDTVDNQEAIQRLEIASSYKVNAKNDSVEIKVKAVNFKGLGATKGKITLELNKEALSNGVTLDGANTRDVDVNGFVTYKLRTNAATPQAVDALVKAGITAKFTTENDVTNSIEIAVENESVSEEKVRYLAFEPIAQRIDYTKSQLIKVRVQAVGENDSALKGEQLSLTRSGLSTEQLQNLGITPKGSSTKPTDENGFADFEFQYNFANTQAQRDLVLNPAGIRLLAKSTNGKTQFLDLKFKEPSASSETVLESLVIDTDGIVNLAVNQPKTINVTVQATGSDGQFFKNQKVGLGLNEAALQNGASIVGGASKITNADGKVSFQIQITAKNASELENLTTNGLMLAVKGTDTDITALRKVELSKPAVLLPELANFAFTKIDGTPLDTISVLGGETRVKIKALDGNGQPISNVPVNIALSKLTSDRVSLSNESVTTNSKGEAEFTVTVKEGKYEPSLIRDGIVFAVVGSSPRTGDSVQQTSSIGITAPANALNPRLTADVNTVLAGQTVKIYASVKDEMGIFTAAGTPMRLDLNQAAKDAGVKLSNEGVVVQANGSIAVDLIIPKGISSVTLSSIVVIGTISDPRGVKLSTNLRFNVQDVINPYHLSIERSKTSFSAAGDTALVTVKLLDNNEGGVANQPVTLEINDPRNDVNSNAIFTSIKGSSQNITNEYGEAVFQVVMKPLTGTLPNPIPPIGLTAKHITNDGAEVSQVSSISVYSPSANTLIPQLDLKFKASKNKLNIRGDAVEVALLVTDLNGSSQPGKAVTLSIPDYRTNGAYIRGASTIESDENGWAKFTVVIDESMRNPTVTFTNLLLRGTVKDANGVDNQIPFSIPVVNDAQVPISQGSIAVTMNPTSIGVVDGTGVYYNWKASAQVTDMDGRPIANQNVTMDIRGVQVYRGQWVPVIKPGDTDPSSWAQLISEVCTIPTVDNAATPYDDRYETIDTGTSINPTNRPETLNVVRFIGESAANPYTATYTTDREGRFDFELHYPKTYGAWLKVDVGAKASLASFPGAPIRGSRLVTLTTSASDFDKSDWAYTPSLDNRSPYGELPSFGVGCVQ